MEEAAATEAQEEAPAEAGLVDSANSDRSPVELASGDSSRVVLDVVFVLD
jgi:hypothetical protein